jgi:predicted dehydrogenase
MGKSVRVGVIGAGAIGPFHMRSYRACRDAEVTAVCDVHKGRAQAAAAEFDIPNVFTDHRKMLAADVVDAVSVCTPNNTHMSITVAALEAGKHVLCEKPLALNGRQARRMVEVGRRRRRILMSAQSMRYRGQSQFLKKLVDGGRLGEVYYAKGTMLRRVGIPRGWFRDVRQSGGGPLIDLGVHMLDLMWWMMGTPKPASAYGVTFDRLGRGGQGRGDWGVNFSPAGFSVEDLAAALVRFQDGRAAAVETSWASHTAELYSVRLLGTKGGAELHPALVIYQADGDAKLDVNVNLPRSDAYQAEAAHFIACIQRGQQPISPASQSVVIMDILDAVYRSARTGRAVSLSGR